MRLVYTEEYFQLYKRLGRYIIFRSGVVRVSFRSSSDKEAVKIFKVYLEGVRNIEKSGTISINMNTGDILRDGDWCMVE